MTSIIKLTVLSGSDPYSPPCYLLQVDEFRFLLDCGLGDDLSPALLDELKKCSQQVDAVLITHPDTFHLGALPYLVGKCGLSCPIYVTTPVYKMGQMFMYDFHQSHQRYEDFELFSLDDVDAAFKSMTQIRLSQTINLKGKGHGLQITALSAGHMIGGTIWKIVKDGEEEIVYALDYNHTRERHLNGASFESIQRPHLLITDSRFADHAQPRRRLRDEQLMTNILSTMRNGGNVLIAVDSAGRQLELVHLLNQMWGTPTSGLNAYSLAMLSEFSFNIVSFAKSQVEWMSDKLLRDFEDNRNNPFSLKHVTLCHTMQDLEKVPSPKAVLAAMPDLECGYAKDLFIAWCEQTRNSVILTSRASPLTLGGKLSVKPTVRKLSVSVKEKVPLSGAELEQYRLAEKERKLLEEQKEQKKAIEDDSSSESEDEIMLTSGTGGNTGKHDLLLATQIERQKSVGASGATRTSLRRKQPMYPFIEYSMRFDDYGEIIRPEDFEIKDTYTVEESAAAVQEEEPMEAEEEPVEEEDIPKKAIMYPKQLSVNCSVSCIDFEGRSDGESMKKILSQIKPRQMILVGGSEESRQMLIEHCKRQEVVPGQIFTPQGGETVDATTERHIFQVRLKDSLVSALWLVKAKDVELSWLDAVVSLEESKSDTQTADDRSRPLQELHKPSAGLPLLTPVADEAATPRQAMMFNELKLSDLKLVLLNAGVPAEFSAGALVCGANQSCAIRKNETGRVLLEGALTEDYFRVRQLLYSQYATV